ncbi:MAG: UDP-N-acetylmuramoyl-tripeptide--D-alanyl-D-alanine ligase, partial [Actinomycetota bacterium]
MIDAAVAVVFAALAMLNGLRWLRVAQREHYLPWSVTRFALRWRWLGVGLSLRGRTSKLAWTRRLRVLAAVAAVLFIAFVVLWHLVVPWNVGAFIELVFVPITIDLALWITRPIEDRLAQPFVKRAADKLRSVKPTIVAITGSYGKTSTKVLLAHLVQGTRNVTASPASFNNRAGLARAINEGLAPGTDVFVAEMGTYGKGEIADLCKWCPPAIAVITAIGPVHLERFKTEDN